MSKGSLLCLYNLLHANIAEELTHHPEGEA